MFNKIKITLYVVYGAVHSKLKYKNMEEEIKHQLQDFSFEDGEGDMRSGKDSTEAPSVIFYFSFKKHLKMIWKIFTFFSLGEWEHIFILQQFKIFYNKKANIC